jgi:hypothetical protein
MQKLSAPRRSCGTKIKGSGIHAAKVMRLRRKGNNCGRKRQPTAFETGCDSKAVKYGRGKMFFLNVCREADIDGL